MTKTAIRRTPKELPYARIYLDDLIEIEELLSREFAKLSRSPVVSFRYQIDDEFVVTTHKELLEHGGFSTNFRLEVLVDSWTEAPLRIYSIVKPTFEAPHQLKDESWALFARVEQIFRKRADRFRVDAITEKTPWWVLLVLMVAVVLMGIVLPIRHVISSAVGEVLTFFPLIISIVGSVTMFAAKSRIYFRYLREDKRARQVKWRERGERLLWLLAGTALGIMMNRFKR